MYNSQEMEDRIKKISSQKGISIIKLHEMCGLSRNVLSQAAKSTDGIKSKNLCTIADALGCSVDYLLGRTDNPASNTSMIRTGDINSSNIGNHNSISISSPADHLELDEMSASLLKSFNTLGTADKARIIVMIDDMMKTQALLTKGNESYG